MSQVAIELQPQRNYARYILPGRSHSSFEEEQWPRGRLVSQAYASQKFIASLIRRNFRQDFGFLGLVSLTK
jgi:hypothetical protein